MPMLRATCSGFFHAMSLGLLLLAPALFGIGGEVGAQDLDALAKQANSGLRGAQRFLFGGQFDEARVKLKEVAGILDRIEAANPRYRSLRSLRQRLVRLQRDLARRSGGSRSKPEVEPKPEGKAGESPALPAGPKLPGGVTHRLKKIIAILDQGRKGDPFKLMEEIDRRYGKDIPADHPTIAAIRKRLAELKRTRDAAARSQAAKEAALRAAREHRAAQGREWADRLKVFLDYKAETYLISSTENNRANPAEKEKRAANYKAAAAVFAEYEKTDFPHGKTPELEDVARRLAQRLEEYRHDVHQVAIARASAPWLKRLDRFVMPYDVEKSRVNRDRLVVPSTRDPQELKRLQGLFEEAKAVLAEYAKASFPLGRSRRLQVVARELEELIRVFPGEYEKNALRLLADPAKALAEAARILASDKSSLADPEVKPRILSQARIDTLHKLIAQAASVAGAEAAVVADLEKRLTALLADNTKRIALRAARTFMLPSRYTGEDGEALKAKAEEILTAKVPGGRILRRTLPSADWREERVWEWTDTTRSATRYRVTRSLTLQAAVKCGDQVTLYTLHIAKDRRTDGTWGPLYGHVMFADAMAEANVGK